MSANPLAGVIVTAVVLVVATVGGLLWRRRDGRLRQVAPASASESATLLPATLGIAPSDGVLLLQFSSAVCAPCRAAHRICAEVAAGDPGVRHREVDAAEHLDAARELGIWRTPTVLVVDGAGRVVHRASGVPAKADLLAAVSALRVDA